MNKVWLRDYIYSHELAVICAFKERPTLGACCTAAGMCRQYCTVCSRRDAGRVGFMLPILLPQFIKGTLGTNLGNKKE